MLLCFVSIIHSSVKYCYPTYRRHDMSFSFSLNESLHLYIPLDLYTIGNICCSYIYWWCWKKHIFIHLVNIDNPSFGKLKSYSKNQKITENCIPSYFGNIKICNLLSIDWLCFIRNWRIWLRVRSVLLGFQMKGFARGNDDDDSA